MFYFILTHFFQFNLSLRIILCFSSVHAPSNPFFRSLLTIVYCISIELSVTLPVTGNAFINYDADKLRETFIDIKSLTIRQILLVVRL